MSVVLQSLWTAGLASVAAAVFWLLGWRLRRAHLWLSALGLTVGFTILYARILGRPDFPPIDATQWAFWLAWLGLPLGWLAGIGAAYRWVWAWGALLGALWLFVLPFRPLIESGFWTPTVGVAYIVGFGVAAWLLMTLSAPLGDESGAPAPLLIALLGAVSAGMLFYGGKSASLAQLSGTLGAVVGVGVLIGLLLSRFTLGRGAVALTMMQFVLLWATAHGFASLTLGQLALLYLLALAPALYALPALQRQPARARLIVPLMILLVIGGGTVGMQYRAYTTQSGDYYSY